jgi:hypothetical protein
MERDVILYHYTDVWCLRTILKEGLKPGPFFDPDDPMLPADVVWLTTQTHQDGIGWEDPKEIRITLVIPSTDERLVRWKRWIQKHDGHLLAGARRGGGEAWACYWIYFGVVPASYIEVWEFTDPALKALYDEE